MNNFLYELDDDEQPLTLQEMAAAGFIVEGKPPYRHGIVKDMSIAPNMIKGEVVGWIVTRHMNAGVACRHELDKVLRKWPKIRWY